MMKYDCLLCGNHFFLKDMYQTKKSLKERTAFRPELLAPAGSYEGLKAVIRAGADAVYIGGSRFGARAYADNPDEALLLDAIDYAHLRGVRVYLTVNTLFKEQELKELCDWIRPYVLAGIDAVLVQDFGALALLHRTYPELELHASTQMCISGPEGAKLLSSCGVTRVVPARELSLPELVRIKRESGLAVECFIHGALCYCYSGMCLYSSLAGGRSGNRGRCAQPCRLLNLLDDASFDGSHSIMEEEAARHFLSPKDLNTLALLPEILEAGIDSLKIEGRMKQPEYAAGVVSVYRRHLDLLLEGDENAHRALLPKDRQMLYDLYNRNGFTDGYFKRHNGADMMAPVKHILTKEETEARHALYDRMHASYMTEELPVPAGAFFSVFAGEPMCACLTAGDVSVSVAGAVAEPARRQPLTEEKLREQLTKTGGTDFAFSDVEICTDGQSFVLLSSLNDLRRRAIEELRTALLKAYREAMPGTHHEALAETKEHAAASGSACPQPEEGTFSGSKPALHAVVSTEEQFLAACEADVALIYVEAGLLLKDRKHFPERASYFVALCHNHGKRAGVAMPHIDRADGRTDFLKAQVEMLIRTGFEIFLVRCLESAAWFVNRNLAAWIRADANVYTWNSEAVRFLNERGIRYNTAPYELNRRELYGRPNRDGEIVVYGHMPMMVSANCIVETAKGCSRGFEQHSLTDRTGRKFSVKCHCDFCYNVISNAVPLNLLSELKSLTEMGFSAFRLDFTGESGALCERILRESGQVLSGMDKMRFFESTKGHFQRGAE